MKIATPGPAGEFNLLRSFAIRSCIVIAIISIVSALLLSRFVREHLVYRDAVVSMEFVQSLSDVMEPTGYFAGSHGMTPALQKFFEQISQLPDVVRVTIYSYNGAIVWSTDESVVSAGRTENEELSSALAGELIVEYIWHGQEEKVEHRGLQQTRDVVFEYYLPIRAKDGSRVLAVAELYKEPTALLETLESGYVLIWSIALISGVVLFVSLFWILRRGNRIIETQQQALIDADRMVIIGNMVASVAHSFRNPLASMRSSAELGRHEPPEQVREYFSDIIREVDRFDSWIRELLIFSKAPPLAEISHLNLFDVVAASVDSFGDRLSQNQIGLDIDIPTEIPRLVGDEETMVKVVNTLISNALEAMPDGGQLRIFAKNIENAVTLSVVDTGIGMNDKLQQKSFNHVMTTKPEGLGVGLVLARRVVEGYGGNISLKSRVNAGTSIYITLPVAS